MPHVDAFSWNLILATAGVAITHTLFGPDHYLPFIMLARARHWSRLRTLRGWRGCAGIGQPGRSLVSGSRTWFGAFGRRSALIQELQRIPTESGFISTRMAITYTRIPQLLLTVLPPPRAVPSLLSGVCSLSLCSVPANRSSRYSSCPPVAVAGTSRYGRASFSGSSLSPSWWR